jgi:sulfur carrier protein ThiS
MKIKVSSPLYSYTNGISLIEIDKPTLNEVIDELDFKFPGIKFRFIDEQDKVRSNMRIFVNGIVVTNVNFPLEENSEIYIVHMISGG